MATYAAIAATSQVVLGLLQRAAPGTEFAGTAFAQYGSLQLQDPMKDGLSVYLYRVSVNGNRRNAPPRVEADGRRYRVGVPLDLHYLVIAWGEPLRQQRLLGWAARVLDDTPMLPSGVLNHFGPDPAVFRASEAVELVLQSPSQQDLSDVWEVAKSRTQPALSYVARFVEIATTVPLDEHAEVQTREFDYAAEVVQ